jgi:hypothetical protein
MTSELVGVPVTFLSQERELRYVDSNYRIAVSEISISEASRSWRANTTGARVVALSVPATNTTRDSLTLVKVIWADCPERTSTASQTDVQACREYIRLPEFVQKCGPALIVCTCLNLNYGLHELLLELFLSGYGGAEFAPDFDAMYHVRAAGVVDVSEQPGLTFQNLNLLRSIASQLDKFSTREERLHRNAVMGHIHGRSSEFQTNNDAFVDDDELVGLKSHREISAPEQADVQALASSANVVQSMSFSPMSMFGSPMSMFGSPMSFMTASSPASFTTARSVFGSPMFSIPVGRDASAVYQSYTSLFPTTIQAAAPLPLQKLQFEFFDHLHQQNIIQPFDRELNWSGKGQHVTFSATEGVPLKLLSHLGSSATAQVDKVLCRRIALARKTMRCSRKWTIAEALREVYHLQNLSHFHIIQLVGTYLQRRNFSILMYPAADCHLGTFLEDTADMKTTELGQEQLEYQAQRSFLLGSMGCLTAAIAYIHEHTTKHMDIKPQNILVRTVSCGFTPVRRVYLADFGLSRSFAAQDHSQTDGPTSLTPRYCAPEVFHYERRGRSADIFSLGCVFLEIMTVFVGEHPHDFAEHRKGDGDDESFHANLPHVFEWIDKHLFDTLDHDGSPPVLKTLFTNMIALEPDKRPSAKEIQELLLVLPRNAFTFNLGCCGLPPEPYEAYEQLPGDRSPVVRVEDYAGPES